MRFSFLLVSLLAPCVLGNKVAGPWQMLFLWYAYQLDVRANGTPAKIAVGCVGTNSGHCYFDELLQYAQRAGQRWNGQSGVGQDLKPDVVSTADSLTKGGYVPNWDNEQLFGKGSNIPQTLAKQWGELIDRVQNIRSTTKIDVSDLVDPLKLAVQGTHEMRLMDNSPELFKALTGYLGYTPEQKTRTALNGQTIVEVDETATQAKHSDFDSKFPGFFAWVDNIKKTSPQRFKQSGLKDFVLHNNAVQEIQRFETRLNAGCA
ncbi:hypothetical protein QBC46DRAFT_409750 [Diplogelasinospora grovesii]|uniref:Uncharacterized protein n=1 Tax=Diplogelasinospora grovesii TaxID=303347 RepID=A0AAN6N4U4_9PEZI|nr:hypothetical protein QBC46DRAFT_409750 [Diplogelasinospora grovesii]